MHAIKDKPVVVDGQIVIRPIMVVALTYDHRLLDGREAVTFLGEFLAFLLSCFCVFSLSDVVLLLWALECHCIVLSVVVFLCSLGCDCSFFCSLYLNSVLV